MSAVQKIDPSDRVESSIVAMKDKLAAALPAHIPADRFVRVALSALNNPQIAECAETREGRSSILNACLKAATDGLLLDGREAALVVRRNKVKGANGRDEWVSQATYQAMVAGVMKKARNSGEIASIVSQVVYANDEFEVDFVTEGPPIKHRPFLGDRGAPVAVYAIARLKDGTWTQPEVLSRDQVEYIRKTYSKQPDSLMWTKAWDEGARKTAIRRASKYWPSSTDRDGRSLDDVIREGEDPIDVDIAAASIPAKPAVKKLAAAALIASAPEPDFEQGEPEHDAETGEIVEADV